MKAIVALTRGPGASLEIRDVPVPKIDASEVLVRVHAIGVGLHDRWFMPQDAAFPYPIGIEAAGIIEKTGKDAKRFHPGDRVMFVSTMQPKGGVWAEFAAVTERALVLLPEALDFNRAAALPVAGGTALASIRLLRPQTADTVFMAGASGAIGTLAIQLARNSGSFVAASASARNQDYLRSIGATLAVDYQDPAWKERVKKWAFLGVNSALAIQPGTGAGCMDVVRDGGSLVTVSGDEIVPERQVKVTQVQVGPEIPAALAILAEDVSAGTIHVEIERVYHFEQGVAALEKTETRHARGKIVLTMD